MDMNAGLVTDEPAHIHQLNNTMADGGLLASLLATVQPTTYGAARFVIWRI